MGQTGRKRWRAVARLTAMAMAVMVVLMLPIDWVRIGQTATLLAAGMQRPANATQLLGKRQTVLMDGSVSVPSLIPSLSDDVLSSGDDEPTVSVPIVSVSPPAEDGTGGKIVSRAIQSATQAEGIAYRNSSGTAADVAAALQASLTPHFTKTDAPQVLIVHTHTTEGYMTYDAGRYNAVDRERTTDHRRSVCAVGEALKATLATYGIVAIHDTTIHDSPYSGAYTRSAKTVETYLKQYPSIQVVLDLHRDAVMDGNTTMVKPTTSVNGRNAAQIMLIAGVLSTSSLPNPYTSQNLALATQWQQALEQQYGGLARPLSMVGSRYNQHLHAGYLLVEVGSEANTVEESVYSAALLGKTLAELLCEG